MNPIEYFFTLGEKITKGDPVRKADWDYYMLLIMFLAFLSILIGNLYQFFKEPRLYYLGWTFVMFAILWFQYFALKGMYELRKMIKTQVNKPEKVESPKEMMEMFKDAN